MSRVGKVLITLPKDAEVNFVGSLLTIKGPLGTLIQPIYLSVRVAADSGTVTSAPADESHEASALQGTVHALTTNMAKGTTTGFERKLNLVGMDYRISVQGTALRLQLGFSHGVIHEMLNDVKAETPTQTGIVIKSSDKQKIGQVAAEVRGCRPPEPYKGRGARYAGKCVTLKETKKK